MDRVSSRNFLHENSANIAQRFAHLSSKNCTKFWCFCALMPKSYFAQILRKMLAFVYFVISCYFVISRYFIILLNFEKKFQEMLNKFKIKPIWVNYTPGCSALTHSGRMSPNSQVLGHQTVLTITPFTG